MLGSWRRRGRGSWPPGPRMTAPSPGRTDMSDPFPEQIFPSRPLRHGGGVEGFPESFLNHQLKVDILEAKLSVPLFPEVPATGEGCAVAWPTSVCEHGGHSEAHAGSRPSVSNTPANGQHGRPVTPRGLAGRGHHCVLRLPGSSPPPGPGLRPRQNAAPSPGGPENSHRE